MTRYLVALLFAFLLFPKVAQAQVASEEYWFCATRFYTVSENRCFHTKPEAEVWIKDEPTPARGNKHLVQIGNGRTISAGKTLYEYKVKPKKYDIPIGEFYYGHVSGNATACSSQAIPVPGVTDYGCTSEQAMLTASLNAYPLAGGGYTGTFIGSYLSGAPTKWSAAGSDYTYISVTMNPSRPEQRKMQITNGPSSYETGFRRTDYYRCPALFQAWSNPSGVVQGNNWPYVCALHGVQATITKVRINRTCSEEGIDVSNGNPCIASSGNKEYREKDFEWEGNPFIRSYNSISDLSLLSGMGDNWAHSYSDRIETITNSSNVTWIQSNGYFETFQYVNNNAYKSTYTSGIKLYYETDAAIVSSHGRYRLSFRSGKQMWFSESGRLRKIEDHGLNLAFNYCTQVQLDAGQCAALDVLTQIVSESGRVLDFEYITYNLASSDTAPDPVPRILRIKASGVVVAEYAYDASARLTHASLGGVTAGEGREYLYAESSKLCLDAAGNALPDCNVNNYPDHLTGVIDEKGNRYATYTYDDSGRVTSSQHANGAGKVTQTYDDATGNVAVSLPDGSLKNYQFSTSASDYRQPVQLVMGDTTTQVQKTTKATFSNGRITSLTNPLGHRTNFTYDTYYLKTRTEALTATGATTPQTRTSQTDWHASFNVPLERRTLNVSNVLEAKTTYAYNTRGQATAMCQIDPSNTTAMAYVCGSATNAPTGVRQSTMSYCEQAGVTAGTCPIVGLMLSNDGPRTDVSDISTYTYYQTDASTCAATPTTCAYRKGDLWKVTNALNHVMETTAYDGAGRALQMKDTNNVITDMLYHPRGWLTHRKVRGVDNATEADDAITQMEYDATGQVIKVTQPDGDFINFTYDAAHRLTGISDALNNSISYTLDNAGNRTAETTKDPSNVIKRSLSRVHDTLGRLQASKNAASTTVATLTYDANDNLNTSTDGLSRVTDQDVDPLNRLIKTIQDQGAGKINATTQFEYDARDNLTKVIDPKALNTVYTYSGLNDLTALTSPDTGSTTYTYDSAGNRKTQTDARNVTSSYSYDSANRLTQVSLPTTTQSVFFDYDATQTDCQAGETFTAGRLARIRDESGSTRYCYNRLGQSVRKVQSVTGGPNLSLGSTYNGANRMVAMTYPSGAIVTYLRNAKGQITGIDAKPTATAAQVSVVSNATYLPFGPLNTLTFGNARVLTKAYDQNYDIDKVSDNSTTGLSQDSTVNVMGNITAITERTTATANTTRQFAYDNLDRLLSLKNGATNVQSFTYDATGNRLSKTLATTTTTNTIAATSHRLTQDGATARTYDANGNTVTTAAKAYVYDDRNRLRDYKNSGTTVTRTYRYNGKGERVSKVVSATSTSNRYFFYDEAGHLLGEYDKTGARIQEYVWLDDQLIAVLSDHDASTYQFVETDHLGTPRAVIHPAENNIVWRWNLTNTAFGEHTATNNPDGDAVTYTFNLRYPGQLYDVESGLHYNYFRDYEPQTGRYVQSDPIGLIGGASTYGYVQLNPLIGSDFFGLVSTTSRPSKGPLNRFFSVGIDTAIIAKILGDRASQLKKLNKDGADQFYHCLAACEATQATNNPGLVLSIMSAKEDTDFWRNRYGKYKKEKKSDENQLADNAFDESVNQYGASCGPGSNCKKACRRYLLMINSTHHPILAALGFSY
jgi:RHS repeat-associated protein